LVQASGNDLQIAAAGDPAGVRSLQRLRESEGPDLGQKKMAQACPFGKRVVAEVKTVRGGAVSAQDRNDTRRAK
jgi:hypothetical protein